MARLAIAVCCYALIFALALFCALLLRFDLGPFELATSVLTNQVPAVPPAAQGIETYHSVQLAYAKDVFRGGALVIVLLKVVVVLISRDWRRRLRYSTIHDVAWSTSVCVASGILIAALQVARETMPQVSRGVIVIDTILSAGAVVAARMLAQTLRTLRESRRHPGARRALIYANGPEAASLVASIQAGASRLRIVGLVSPRNTARNGLLSGIPMFNASAGLEAIIRRTRAELVLLPSQLAGRTIREVTDVCSQLGIAAHLVPTVDEIPSGRFQLRLRDITIDDLLRREPNQLDLNGIRSILRNRVVLVTGAAGSIGSEVCRQLLKFAPRKIILLDQSEFGIFQMEQEFEALSRDPALSAIKLEYLIEDITDEAALSRIFMLHRPAVVFHAAAYKHVPLMESNPQAAIRNNIFGTRTLVDVADKFAVERFVMISTDKAVRPTNVMGATKLIAEQYLLSVAESSETRFITVRFGNVLNSAGSVVPTFRRQIEAGGPVTVTDPGIERYFMTIPEAVQLVLQSAAAGQGGDVLILDMGEPVRIVDLARDMIRLSGQRCPEDIEIVFTGLRPGEKLYEELFYETEQNAVRVHEKIFRSPRQLQVPATVIRRDLQTLEGHLHASREELREVLWQVTSAIVERSSAPEELATPANPVFTRTHREAA